MCVQVPVAAFSPRPGHSGQLQVNLTAVGLTELGQIGRWDSAAPSRNDSSSAGPWPAPLEERMAWDGVQV